MHIARKSWQALLAATTPSVSRVVIEANQAAAVLGHQLVVSEMAVAGLQNMVQEAYAAGLKNGQGRHFELELQTRLAAVTLGTSNIQAEMSQRAGQAEARQHLAESKLADLVTLMEKSTGKTASWDGANWAISDVVMDLQTSDFAAGSLEDPEISEEKLQADKAFQAAAKARASTYELVGADGEPVQGFVTVDSDTSEGL